MSVSHKAQNANDKSTKYWNNPETVFCNFYNFLISRDCDVCA